MSNNISLPASFLAGILSFISPCVLPLLSSYLFFISGERNIKNIKDRVMVTIFFILGFTIIFVTLSVIVYGIFMFAGSFNTILNYISGGIVALLGANIIFQFIPFLKYDTENENCASCIPEHSVLALKKTSFLHPVNRSNGSLGAFIAGLAFGAGWTPCVGVFLGSILLLAGQSEGMIRAVLCLILYSAGLGVPFILSGIFWGIIVNKIDKIKSLLPVLRVISGIFLIFIGFVIIFGRLFMVNAILSKNGNIFYDFIIKIFPNASNLL